MFMSDILIVDNISVTIFIEIQGLGGAEVD